MIFFLLQGVGCGYQNTSSFLCINTFYIKSLALCHQMLTVYDQIDSVDDTKLHFCPEGPSSSIYKDRRLITIDLEQSHKDVAFDTWLSYQISLHIH